MVSPKNNRKPVIKTNPNLRIELDEFQRESFKQSFDYDFNFILGDVASGKTACAAYTALYHKIKYGYSKIYATRGIVDNKKLGALPGSMEDKIAPYVFPIMQNLEACKGKTDIENMISKGVIEILPAETIKGVTVSDSILIVDEFEDLNYEDFRKIISRVGEDSKVIFCGSFEQIDSSIGSNSCLYKISKLKDSGLVGWSELKSNHRNPMLMEILNYIEK